MEDKAGVSVVEARPFGAGGPPDEVLIATPVFRYGLSKSMLPTRGDARLVIQAEGERAPLAEIPFGAAQTSNGFLVFEVGGAAPGVRYDAHIALGDERILIFRGAELFRLAIDDPGYRAMPAGGAPVCGAA